MIGRSLLLQMANSKRLESFVRGNRISSRSASRFVAGETIQSITDPVRDLNKQGISVSLDHLGESVSTRKEVSETIDTYLNLFQHIAADQLNANVSLKLTAVGLDIDPQFCYDNMVQILTTAGSEQFVRIDMEGSNYTQPTLDLFYKLWKDGGFRNVGVVIQSYLRRSQQDAEDLIEIGARVRLCKGAYKEPDELAFPEKADVDSNYIRLMQRLLADGVYPGIATHDPKMISATKEYAAAEKIALDRFEFQMLFGIRRDLQSQLVKDGYRMRVYVPFGTHWYPYLMRRLAERPANVWFVVKNILKSR